MWKKVSDGVDGSVDFHTMAVSPVSPNIVYALTQENKLYKSADVGETWIQIR